MDTTNSSHVHVLPRKSFPAAPGSKYGNNEVEYGGNTCQLREKVGGLSLVEYEEMWKRERVVKREDMRRSKGLRMLDALRDRGANPAIPIGLLG
jgi:hypothetical protein